MEQDASIQTDARLQFSFLENEPRQPPQRGEHMLLSSSELQIVVQLVKVAEPETPGPYQILLKSELKNERISEESLVSSLAS